MTNLQFTYTVDCFIACGDALMVDLKTGKVVPFDAEANSPHIGYAHRDYDKGETLILETPVEAPVYVYCECLSCHATGLPELFMRYKPF